MKTTVNITFTTFVPVDSTSWHMEEKKVKKLINQGIGKAKVIIIARKCYASEKFPSDRKKYDLFEKLLKVRKLCTPQKVILYILIVL